ncbi:MAG: hypothetical protein L3J07_01270 [Candidatus Magasanikbacteria bacterium]|nr:hypothetical protein [Candidatus Magasanikbacteria bacterium]
MSLIKKTKDQILKLILGDLVPRELLELHDYFRLYNNIAFDFKKGKNGEQIAISNNFRYGSIITSGKNVKELDKNIKDAILTSFGVPSSYKKETKVYKVGKRSKEYALA